MGKSQSKSNHFFNDEEIKKITEVYNNDGLDAVFPLIKGKCDNLDNEKVTIAVTGESGVGKSAFINLMRGLGPNDEGAAEEGIIEQTSEPTPYQHPMLPSVCLWDLPGIGTTRFSARQYLDKVNFNTYDLFVLIAGERFKENDAKLAKEIKKMGKEFYFVRSRMDVVEENLSKRGQRDRLEKEFDKIRSYYKNSLEQSGLHTSQVFLVSSRYPDRYDFMQFCDCLESELPEKKKNVFVLSLPSLTEAVIEKKKTILQAKIALAAVVSAGIGAVPVPGLSFACDIAILVATLMHMRSYLGLDDESLCRLACRVNKPVQELKAEITSPFVLNITPSSVIKLLTSTVSGAAMVADDVILLIPVIGSVIGATVSFTATSFLLNSALDDFTKSAVKVLRKVTEDDSEQEATENISLEHAIAKIQAKLSSPFTDNGLEDIINEIQYVLDQREFHIAVTGEAGTGKSAFVNAVCGLKPGHPKAAKEGCTEQTMEPKKYKHPSLPSVFLWDLPGAGTPTFEIAKYLKAVNFKKYHFIILIVGNRLTENDKLFVEKIREMRQDFYVVRSKMDEHEQNGDRYSRKKGHQKIKDYYISNFKKNGMDSPHVFLVSSHCTADFDFTELCQGLKLKIEEKKKDLSSCEITEIVKYFVEKKKTKLKGTISQLISYATDEGTTFIPGTACAYNCDAIVEILLFYRWYMGLDDESINQLAGKVGKSVEDLKAYVSDPFVFYINPNSVHNMFSSSTSLIFYNLQSLLRPLLGVPKSSEVISKLLESKIDIFAESAMSLAKKAM
ncbi:interferon-inducible GTPase 5-like [Polypterus senegalus]|uniref:interferon-inducible GTPase 5-like n=1 Tax=Polypterus senegalus TaxID=55291 RepID=UPI00196257DE|nr:interferon-inducible GTPase 5-like [Polypterus senegalus]XP_039621241.1 interferon-inducible GTPase 5-like [Polypterus senegalus]